MSFIGYDGVKLVM